MNEETFFYFHLLGPDKCSGYYVPYYYDVMRLLIDSDASWRQINNCGSDQNNN